jgi:hypothetical protein
MSYERNHTTATTLIPFPSVFCSNKMSSDDPTAHLHEAPQPQTNNHSSGWWTMPGQMDFEAMMKQRFNGNQERAAQAYQQLYDNFPPLSEGGRFANTLGTFEGQKTQPNSSSANTLQ